MDEKETLRWFLIRRFIIIMGVTALVEYITLFFLNNLLFPSVNQLFFNNISWKVELNILQIIYLIFIALLYLIVLFLKSISPSGLGAGLDWMIGQFDKLTVAVMPEIDINELEVQLSPEQTTVLFAVGLLSIILLFIPFLVGALFYAKEITTEVQKIQLRKEQMQREYDRKRNLMLSDIAHDLRTPMTTVAGYSKALADGMVTDEAKVQEYLHAIQAKSKRMNDLINLLFEYVRLDSDGFSLTKAETDIAELTRECAAMIYSDMEDAEMEFDVDIPEEKIMVSADGIQVSRVITNLLTNSIRHNPKGTRIKLFLETLDEQEHRIYVADNGREIDPAVAEHLFEPFAVSDESRSSKGGSGLGLSIAKKIVEMHGWQLELSHKVPGFTKAFVITVKSEE